MNSQHREEKATELVDHIGAMLSAQVLTQRLTEQLLELRIVPSNRERASIILAISPDEVIFTAGYGTRFELDSLPTSASEAIRLAVAVAHGGLTKEFKTGRVTFTLRLDDGSLLTGASVGAGRTRRVRDHRLIHYPSYGDRQ